MKLSMKIQPDMTPYGVAVSLHDPHVLARSSLPAGIDDDVFVGSALAPDPSPDGSMAVVGAFHEAGAAACLATSSAPQAAEPQKPKKKRKSATRVATAAAPMHEAKCCPKRALERRPTTSSFAKTSKHSEGTGTTCKRVHFTAAVDASATDMYEQAPPWPKTRSLHSSTPRSHEPRGSYRVSRREWRRSSASTSTRPCGGGS
jgi:hypothetical protein